MHAEPADGLGKAFELAGLKDFGEEITLGKGQKRLSLENTVGSTPAL